MLYPFCHSFVDGLEDPIFDQKSLENGKFLPQMQSSGMPGAPGSLEVVATDGAVEIEDFAGQVQSRLSAALHILKVHLAELDSTGRDLGLGVSKRPGNLDAILLQAFNHLDSYRPGKFGHMRVVIGPNAL
jgi:hypothetical protein